MDLLFPILLCLLLGLAWWPWALCAKCRHCAGQTPYALKIDISGVTGPGCCSAMNDSFTLTSATACGAEECKWVAKEATPCGWMLVALVVDWGNHFYINIYSAGGGVALWTADLGEAPLDCMAWNELVMSAFADPPDDCDYSLAVVKVTAL